MTIKEFEVKTSKDINGYVATNGDYSVALSSESQAFMVCNMINRMIRQKFDGGINECENCHHYNSLIHWGEGIFHQCRRGNNLWDKCNDYDPIEESSDVM